MGSKIPWTPALIEKAGALWQQGAAEWVAEQLGYPGKRSAILSMLKKHGYTCPQRKGSGNQTRAKEKVEEVKKVKSPDDRPQLRQGKPVAHRPRLHGPVPTPLVQLTPRSCRWPLWGDRVRLQSVEDAMFCGERTAWEGCSWCTVHLVRASTPARGMKARLLEGQPDLRKRLVLVGETAGDQIALATLEEYRQEPLREQSDEPTGSEKQD